MSVPGIFRDFRWSNDLPDFGRYNLIYGWNGTGKTTLSRVFRALESQKPLPSGDAILRIDGNDLGSADFGTTTLPVRVFNRDFVNETVFPTGGGEVAPIFVLGKESVEKQKQAERLKAEREATREQLDSARTAKKDAETSLDGFCVKQAHAIKKTLSSSGSHPYNNYNKTDFRRRVGQMVQDDDAAAHLLSDTVRDQLLIQHRATPEPQLSLLNYQMPALQDVAGKVEEMLSTTVVSKAIKALRNDQALSAWIRTGLNLHQERKTDDCLFCEQPLPSTRLSTLEDHFSTEYENFLQQLDSKIRELQKTSKQASDVAVPNRAELYDDLASEYEAAKQSLTQTIEVTRSFLDALIDALTDKKGRVFDRLELEVTVPSVDTEVVDNLNAVICKHNQASEDFETRVRIARDRVALDMIAAELDEFDTLQKGVQNKKAAIQPLDHELNRLNGEIQRLEREIMEHRQPAEELNEDLNKYLGHGELQLEIRETGYAILRDDIPAEALSEGETTAIAVLYFLKSLQDRRFELNNGVVVLDDPVSSLDSNALYLAFGFICERTENAAQLIVLTHNFTFFRQVRNWFHHLPGQNKRDINQRPARFYMLDSVRGETARSSTLRPLDPLLKEYESEYHYLFARIFREATSSSPADLEQNYALPNMARRLLETFLAFRQPQVAGQLRKKLESVNFDETKKLRILRFVHTYSHGDAIGEPDHDPSLLGEARAVLNDLLEFIEDQDAQHFAGMKELVEPAEEGQDRA
jgi:wobble nucleotide-excising tRNase